MSSQNDNMLCVGVIKDAYHMHGLVRIKTFTEKAENICNLACMYKNGDEVVITKGSGADIFRLEGVSSRTEAEKLIGHKIYINKDALPPLESDEFYINDLTGLAVLDMQGDNIGKIKGCFNFGAGDILEISFTNGKSEMILFTKENFPEVSTEGVKLKA